MHTQNNILGAICIIFGSLLFFSVTNILLFQLLTAFVAYKIVNYGMALCGLPPISFYIKRQFFQGF